MNQLNLHALQRFIYFQLKLNTQHITEVNGSVEQAKRSGLKSRQEGHQVVGSFRQTRTND